MAALRSVEDARMLLHDIGELLSLCFDPHPLGVLAMALLHPDTSLHYTAGDGCIFLSTGHSVSVRLL